MNNRFFFLPTILFSSLIIIVMGGCSSSDKQGQQTEGETVRVAISGAFALYPLVTVWAEEFNKTHPNIQFDIQAGGAGKGMADVLSGATDVGMFSRTIAQAEKDQGVWWVAVTKDAVLPTISSENPYLPELHRQGVTHQELSSIWLSENEPSWNEIVDLGSSGNETITVFTRSDASGAAEVFATYLGAHQEDLNGVGVMGDPGLAEAVRKDQLSVGYNNTIYVYDVETGEKNPGIDVIPLDLNANGVIDEDEAFYDNFDSILKAVGSGKYPSPPARELYLITNGEPEKQAVISFIEWVLTDGQEFVRPSGYVPLDESYVQDQLTKLQD
ncbi:PstS family phosphate ABC transporter substrate-binding protein [Gracilimonas mengyeensis]|uniref:Phosphate transport system substrate-binding protein n=1 Tax=Gracilimonas mengyeensis TaxID=1302730 RepID=A0A521ET56_9BACT|nr:PstS family phosphate ABC transporter substrate-binding protein [Gracilimonas mengyeensis]SMO87097.1 phosphate transport system substrate-binding protein [Gracilimonas mengyeensis]